MTFELDSADPYDDEMRDCLRHSNEKLIELGNEYAQGDWDVDEYLEQIEWIILERRRKQNDISKRHDRA